MPLPDWFKRHILPDYWRTDEPQRSGPKRILVVEDEHHVARLVQVNLARQGYEVSWLRFGEDAIEDVPLDPPSLIVLDSTLPDVAFAEILAELKTEPESAAVPIIALLGSKADEETFRRWARGYDSFLVKPFNPMELIAFVRRAFRSLKDADSGHVIIDFM